MELGDVAGSPSDHPIQEIFWPKASMRTATSYPAASFPLSQPLADVADTSIAGSKLGPSTAGGEHSAAQIEDSSVADPMPSTRPAGRPGYV